MKHHYRQILICRNILSYLLSKDNIAKQVSGSQCESAYISLLLLLLLFQMFATHSPPTPEGNMTLRYEAC